MIHRADDDPSRPSRRTAAAGLLGLAIAGSAASFGAAPAGSQSAASSGSPAGPRRGSGPPRTIEVAARPIAGFERGNSAKRQFGRLEFRGGLVLSSEMSEFGGLSGVVMDDDGRRFLAITDQGSWLAGEVVYDGSRPRGLRHVVLGPIMAVGGRPLDRTRDRDSESITLLDGTLSRGSVLISFERNHRIGRFPVGERGLEPPTGYLKLPAESRRMSSNRGLEAVGVIRGGPLRGAIIAFAEEYYDARRNHTGWLWPQGFSAEPQRLNLVNIADFAITDMASLPDGSLIVLERKFRWLEGVKMRLRLIRAAAVRPGALLDGEILVEADMGYDIDNMEGLALHRDPRGGTVLSVVSDDNFNHFLQRTLLLQFLLPDAPVAKVVPSSGR